MDREKIQAIIAAALRRSGQNPYRAAVGAGLPADAIRHLLAGHEPKAGRLAQICAALGLEFYIGPPRPATEVSQAASLSPAALSDLESSVQTLNRVLAEAGCDPVPDDLWSALVARKGVQPPAIEDQNVPARSVPIELVDLSTETRGGAEETRTTLKSRIWLSLEWLERRGLDPTRCALIGVHDKSMEPTLPEGSLILFDRACTDWLPDHILVVRTDEGLVAKRAANSDSGQPLMVSDHPDWPDIPLPDRAKILGQVRWMARGFD